MTLPWALARSLPFDFVKTRMQKMEKGPDGKYPYKSPMDCAMQTFRNEVRLLGVANSVVLNLPPPLLAQCLM